MIYKFPKRKNESHSKGYATVIISNGEANIDKSNKLQVALAEKLGGMPRTTPGKKIAQKKEPK